jgi:hypothetical protein
MENSNSPPMYIAPYRLLVHIQPEVEGLTINVKRPNEGFPYITFTIII